MPRNARIICPGIPHHVTQRGNRQEDIFLDDDDRRTYLRILAQYAGREHLRILAYCLMGNHLHLIVTPKYREDLGNVMRAVHLVYAQYVNGKYGWSGHVFGSRYYSCPLDDEHLWAAMRYVEQNPLRARMVERAEDWLWSSAPAHCGKSLDPLLDTRLMKDWPPSKWRKWLAGENPDEERELRLATRAGRPCGGPAFIRKIERLLGRKL